MKMFAAILLVMTGLSANAQKMVYKGFPSLAWPRLYDISFVQAKDDLGEYDKPVFTSAVKALENKSVVLPGYMVPLDNALKSSRIMISSLPLNACFFCGVGGPETVIEVHLKTETTYIEQPVEVKGILRLNDNDPEKMIYLLEEGEILGPVGF